MKKARTIKVIKSGGTGGSAAVLPLEENSKAEIKKSCPVKVVNDWVREHHEQKMLAEQVALSLLVSVGRSDKINDKYSIG
jgi:hypothetical protein